MSDKSDLYNQHLKHIQGIAFTRRQIDVLACLASGWTIKATASRLAISPSTVESHLEMMGQKLGSGSRQHLLTFIETSGKETVLRTYYQLLIQDTTPESDVASGKKVPLKSPPVVLPQEAQKSPRFLVVSLSVVFLIASSSLLWYFFLGSRGEIQDQVRSDLPLPHTSVLLPRTNLKAQIEKAFKSSDPLPTVILVGIAGAGKTTLARLYARADPAPIVWELNAESKKALQASFEHLASVLATQEKDQETLRHLRYLAPQERKQGLLRFIRKRLKASPGWLLLYDNVESLTKIQSYFPQDPTLWGHGKVLITTRNKTLKNTSFLKDTSVVLLEELTPLEQKQLFTKIVTPSSPPTPPQDQEQRSFLTSLPPFPLDIATAAYYLKDTQIFYTAYLERLKALSPEFEKAQEDLLQEVSSYTLTRYRLVTMTLENLLAQDPAFSNLLLLISLLDSQNIPVELLKKVASEIVVERFLHALRQQSLIPYHDTQTSFFSLHRSVQSMSRAYLSHALALTGNPDRLALLVKAFGAHVDAVLESENLLAITSLLIHGKKLVKNPLISEHLKGDLWRELGSLRGYLCEDERDFAQKSLTLQEKYYGPHHLKTAASLVLLGSSYQGIGHPLKAKKLLERSWAIYQKHSQDKSLKAGKLLLHLGNAYKDLGLYTQAQSYFEDSLAIHEAYFGKNHLQTIPSLVNLGKAYRDLGFYEESEALSQRGFSIYKKHYGSLHFRTAWALTLVGRSWGDLKKTKKAIEALQKALDVTERCFGRTNIQTVWTKLCLGRVLIEVGDLKQARLLLSESFLGYKKYFGTNHLETTKVLYELGRLSWKEGNFQEAEKKLQASLDLRKKAHHPLQHQSYEALGDVFSDLAQKSTIPTEQQAFQVQAQASYQKALDALTTFFPPASLHLKGRDLKKKALKAQ